MSRYFQDFVLWRLSLVVCCSSSERAAVAESQPLSQNREIAVCSLLSSSGHFNSVSVGAAKNPAVSGVVCPTAGVPALTSSALMSLYFVLLTQPATSCPCVLPSSLFQCGSHALRSDHFQSEHGPLLSSRYQSGSSEYSGAPDFSLVTCVPGLKVSVCSLLGGGPLVSARSPVQVATASRRPNA